MKILIILLCFVAHSQQTSDNKKLLVISLDGFRWDYLNFYPEETSAFPQLISKGVFVEKMQPVFQTLTFPTHWSMVTGLYAESHGVVSNSMYDPEFKKPFNFSTTEERWWNGSLPVWVTAKEAGMKTASLSWPGGDVTFNGIRNDFSLPFYPYMNNQTLEERVDLVLDWFTNEDVQLVFLYYAEVDFYGHEGGTKFHILRKKLAEVNKNLLVLMTKLEDAGILEETDIIITSDHGMSDVNPAIASFEDELVEHILEVSDEGAVLGLFAKPGQQEVLLEKTKQVAASRNLPVQVFSRDSIPERLHYSAHRRIPDVVVLGNLGIYVQEKTRAVPWKGTHGWDNTLEDMKVPFIGLGPRFRSGVRVSEFRQVDVYGLICAVLQLDTCHAHNGSAAVLDLMLQKAETEGSLTIWHVVIVCLLTMFMLRFLFTEQTAH